MRYFLDTEYINRGGLFPLELISIGVVAEDGLAFYRESGSIAVPMMITSDPWLAAHVWPHLEMARKNPDRTIVKWEPYIADDLLAFVGPDPEFWGYHCAYDWVVVTQLFGDFTKHPPTWPMICHDLRTLLDLAEMKHVTQPESDRHHALDDARWIAETFKGVMA